MTAVIRLRCLVHPHYQAKGEPRADCKACKEMYKFVNLHHIKGVLKERAGK